MKSKNLERKVTSFLMLAIVILSINACRVHYVADYDENINNEIIRISKEIDKFYTMLLAAPVSERSYEHFDNNYLAIEVDLRSLLMRNKIRPLNEESTRQTEIALELWLDDKSQHKENDTVSNFIITQHRNQFQRIFITMAIGESAKEE